MSDKNIDKDIDILKNIISDDVVQFYCTENAQKLCDNYCEKNNEHCFYLQAIENVIKKLEYYRQIHEKVEFVDFTIDYKRELETWEKIAEKLAEKCNMTKLGLDYFETDNDYFNGKVYMTTEEKIDWARNEVESGK